MDANSLSEYVLSITGVTLPASMSWFRNCRSSLLVLPKLKFAQFLDQPFRHRLAFFGVF